MIAAVLPIMTEEQPIATANAAAPNLEAGRAQTSAVEDEKRISTSRRPSLHQHASSPIPEVAPVLGAVGFVGEPSENAQRATTAFKHHPVEPLAHHDEKHVPEEHAAQVSDKEGSAGTAAPIVKESEQETDGEADDEIIYPGKLQLGLLTLGLCLATFTVALGTPAISHCVVHCRKLEVPRYPRSLDAGS